MHKEEDTTQAHEVVYKRPTGSREAFEHILNIQTKQHLKKIKAEKFKGKMYLFTGTLQLLREKRNIIIIGQSTKY